MVDVWNSDEELEAVDAMTVEQIRAHLMQPNRCWSDTYCDCVQQRAAERMLEHYDALAAENAALKAQLAYAASTGDECAIEVESLRSRLAEAHRWIGRHPHQEGCPWRGLTRDSEGLLPGCVCGRDALLASLDRILRRESAIAAAEALDA